MYLFELWFFFFPDRCPGMGLLDHVVILFLVLKEPPYIVCYCLYVESTKKKKKRERERDTKKHIDKKEEAKHRNGNLWLPKGKGWG